MGKPELRTIQLKTVTKTVIERIDCCRNIPHCIFADLVNFFHDSIRQIIAVLNGAEFKTVISVTKKPQRKKSHGTGYNPANEMAIQF